MNICAPFLLIVFSCTAIAQKQEVIQIHLEQVKKEEAQKETILQQINRVAIETAPFWIPFAVSFFLDSYRAQLCDKLCEKIDPHAPQIDLGIIHLRPKDAARIGLEGASRLGLYALLHGSFENGFFKPNLGRANIESAFWNTGNYVMIGYLLPGVFKDVTAIANFVPHTLNQQHARAFEIKNFGTSHGIQKYCFDESGLGNALKKVIRPSWYTYMYYPHVKAVLNKVKQPQNSNQ